MLKHNSEKSIKNKIVKNPFVVPPMVAFGLTKGDGFVTDEVLSHYDKLSKGGAGIVIVEATCINKNARLASKQLGIWDDKYIEGLKRISELIHTNGCLAILQLHHAGLKAREDITDIPLTSSDYKLNGRSSRGMTLDEINTCVKDFEQGGRRADLANFDGVEIHGAHGYLLTQFFSSKVNNRMDTYGGSFENKLRIAKEIYTSVNNITRDDFIIGIRMGCNDDNLEESIQRARALEEIGYDYLHVSSGFDNTPLEDDIDKDFPCNWIVYGGTKIKEQVKIPVIGVNMIKTAYQINYLLENDLLDFIAIGRPQLADPNFINKILNEEEVISCLECKPCKCFNDIKSCPRYINK